MRNFILTTLSLILLTSISFAKEKQSPFDNALERSAPCTATNGNHRGLVDKTGADKVTVIIKDDERKQPGANKH